MVVKNQRFPVNLSIILLPAIEGLRDSKKMYKSLLKNVEYVDNGRKSITIIFTYNPTGKNGILIFTKNEGLREILSSRKDSLPSPYSLAPTVAYLIGSSPSNFFIEKPLLRLKVNDEFSKKKERIFENSLKLSTDKISKLLDIKTDEIKKLKSEEVSLLFDGSTTYLSLIFLIIAMAIAYLYFGSFTFYSIISIPPIFLLSLALVSNNIHRTTLKKFIYILYPAISSQLFIPPALLLLTSLMILFILSKKLNNNEKNYLQFFLFTISIYSLLIFHYSSTSLFSSHLFPSFTQLKAIISLYHISLTYLVIWGIRLFF
jgi:hypothetical protein